MSQLKYKLPLSLKTRDKYHSLSLKRIWLRLRTLDIYSTLHCGYKTSIVQKHINCIVQCTEDGKLVFWSLSVDVTLRA